MSSTIACQVQRIIEAGLQKPYSDRLSSMESACGNDPSLLQEVLSLLPFYEVAAPSKLMSFVQWARQYASKSTTKVQPAIHVPATPPDVDLPGFIDYYRVLHTLGRGGMGIVYRCWHPTLRSSFAVKVSKRPVLSVDELRRISMEIQIYQHLQRPGHPGISRFVHRGHGELVYPQQRTRNREKRPYIVMEDILGKPLLQYAEMKKLTTGQRLGLFLRLCDAVAYMHRKGIVHLDLKPSNILVDEGGQPQILDFGAAFLAEGGNEIYEGPSLVCTPKYASPEHLARQVNKIGTASDVYTLGFIAFELLTGKPPLFPPCDVADASALDILSSPDESEEERRARHRLAQLLTKSLMRVPARRPQTAEELGILIRDAFGRGPANPSLPLVKKAKSDRESTWDRLHATISRCSALNLIRSMGAEICKTKCWKK